MPILQPFTLPKTAADLAIPASTNAFFVAFLASKDPSTKKPWCPDVVAALPTLESTFTGAKKPQAAFVEVGQRPEYVNPPYHFLQNTVAPLSFRKSFLLTTLADGEMPRTCLGLLGMLTMCLPLLGMRELMA